MDILSGSPYLPPMVDEPDSLVLALLREIREDVRDTKLRVSSLEVRLTTVETQLGQLVANEQIHYGVTQDRLLNTLLDAVRFRDGIRENRENRAASTGRHHRACVSGRFLDPTQLGEQLT